MRHLLKYGILLVLTLVTTRVFVPATTMAQQAKRVTVQEIRITGNRRIPEDTIRFYIQSRAGEFFDLQQLEQDLRALYKANFFETIEIDEIDGDLGKILTFIVKEKPLVRGIEYTGNKSFSESDILEHFKEMKVGLTVDSQYDAAKIRLAERALKELMTQNGKPLGTVRSEVETIPPSSVRVKFVMDEGPKVRIGKISFSGNKIFSEAELKGALQLNKERGLFTIFKGTDKYHPQKLLADIEQNLKDYYKQFGYLHVQVGMPVTRVFEGPRGYIPMFRKTKQQFFIELPIDAGEQYRVGEIKIEDATLFNNELLVGALGQQEGGIVNMKAIRDGLDEIKKLYGNYGYINWSYLPEQSFDEDSKTMNLTIKMVEDKQFFVDRITFHGNTKTRDKVIRREFQLQEQRVFSSFLLDRSILRVNQLGFFEPIEEKDYEVQPDEKSGTVGIDVNLKERSQQSIGITGGVSGISGSFIGLTYSTNNFMGRGESLAFSITGGTRTTDFLVSFTEPYFLDSRWSMGISLFNQRFRFDTFSAFGIGDLISGEPIELFTRKTTGVTFRLSRPLGFSFWRLGGSYSYQNINIDNIAPGFEAFALGQLIGFVPGGDPADALKGIKRSEFTPSLSFNSTNHFFFPTNGKSLTGSIGITGGFLGGDFSMIRPVVEYKQFMPDRWLSKGRHTIGYRFLGEYVQPFGGSAVPFFDRFFSGGETTIRGFDIRSISPLAISTTNVLDQNGNPIIDLNTGLARVNQGLISVGGDTLGVFNGEYRIPIAGPLSMAVFFDAGINKVVRPSALGSLFGATSVEIIPETNGKLRSSTGVEVSFLLPVVSAPFRLIFAYNPHIMDATVMVGNTPLGFREPRKDIKFTIGRSF